MVLLRVLNLCLCSCAKGVLLMSDIVSNINSLNHLALVMMIPLAMMIGGTMIAIITVIACQWRRVRLAEMKASLKQQMLDKGMSAAEIDQVIKASREANGTACRLVRRATLLWTKPS